MLDIARLKRIKLQSDPMVQRAVSWIGLWPNYNLPPRVRIELEGAELIPDGPTIRNLAPRWRYVAES